VDHVHPNPAMGVGFFRLAVTGSQLRWVPISAIAMWPRCAAVNMRAAYQGMTKA
jgi:hypothetical protein